MAKNYVKLKMEESVVLNELRVELVGPADQDRWEAEVCEHHYLKSARMVGEQLRYAVSFRGTWLALLGWSAGAYHLKGRDAWIGWSKSQCQGRLAFVANNARFVLLSAPGQLPNLASRALALCAQRLSEDWQSAYGHRILIVESFVDQQLFRGTAYKASGWRALGCTAGYARVAEDFYVAHDRPKTLYVRELVKHAARTLRARILPPALAAWERAAPQPCDLPVEELNGLWQVFRRCLPEPRDARGLRHSQATVLAITFCSLFNGKAGGYRQAALYGQGLTRAQRVALSCWFNRRTRAYEVPGENCFYRVLSAVEVVEFQRAVWAWQAARQGYLDGEVLALDGKSLRGSGTTQLVGAVNLQSGRTLGVERVSDKSNEIPAGRTLLDRLDIQGLTVLLDALHTQVQTARTIVQEGGGDYVLVIKGNQEGLLNQARTLLPESVPPYGRNDRRQLRAVGATSHRGPLGHSSANGFSPCAPVGASGSRAAAEERQD